MGYFDECNTYEEVKKLYRKLAKEHHPDVGGDAEIFKKINNEYEKITEDSFSSKHSSEPYEFGSMNYEDLSEELKTKFNLASALPEVEVEIIGNWLWVTGNTLANKEKLKAGGFKYSKKKKAWYYHEQGFWKKSKKSYTVEELRDLFGSDKIKKTQQINSNIA